ncbi:hypothetical protein [Clostridium bowmanii]|nr:hypothetical protein [Clostridium bowmanii]
MILYHGSNIMIKNNPSFASTLTSITILKFLLSINKLNCDLGKIV